MKWFHWVILVCVAVAGLLVWLYMLGSREDVNKKMEAVRAGKILKKLEEEPEKATEEKKPDESNP
jgi:hypothetical protein